MAGEAVSAKIMSTSGAMPFSMMPMTVAEKGSAVVPRSTVRPVAAMPSTNSVTGNGSGHGSGSGTVAPAGSAAIMLVRRATLVVVTMARRRSVDVDRLMVRHLDSQSSRVSP
jgi:hypothetical protein